ncbi:MAG: hypothetical protein QOD39_83 [Mycobacterium sp.]|nr:hypothetical protein [Mycobacterium sp.]
MFGGVDEAGLVGVIEDATRAEAAAAARRSAAIAALVTRRVVEDADESRSLWVCDGWDCAAAEIAAAMNISHRKASGQMRIAETLRDHLPLVAGLFGAGRLNSRVVSAITWRTRLITDDAVWARIDAALAARALKWGPLSDEKLVAAVDALVHRFDPGAVIESSEALRNEDFVVGYYDDESGLTSVHGRLQGPDAEVLKKKIAAMAATVCDNDPRTQGQRRGAAMRAWANGNSHLPCACGLSTCPVAGQPAPKSSVVVTVVADQTAVDAAMTDAATSAGAETATTPQAAATPARDVGTAIVSGTVVPTPMLAELLRNGATLRQLCPPAAEPEAGYRPSAALVRFIRCRDLTCRFPGCTMAAEFCDIDHVVPYPIGATHPSNLVCLCRKHHHLKTFWTGDWSLTLQPDGVAVWTAPTGRTYTTHPGSRSFFPDWDTATTELPVPRHNHPPAVGREVKMPLRQRTRAADYIARIKTERAQNNRQHTQTDPDPPPF